MPVRSGTTNRCLTPLGDMIVADVIEIIRLYFGPAIHYIREAVQMTQHITPYQMM